MFIVIGVLIPVNADTNIYHVQIIKWYNEYGTIPGLANLFPRYGLGSNWFNLISIFKVPFFSNNNYTWLNTTTVIWFFVWLVNKWKFHKKNATASVSSKVLSHLYLLLIVFCLFEWELFRDAANSTNYDFIVTALTIVIVLFLIEEILLPPITRKFSFKFVIICISLIPFKLSGAFAILLLLYYLFSFKKNKYWVYSFIIGLIITIPFLIKNYIITGYPLYPVSLRFYSPDWQVPVAMTDYLRQFIHVTNRYYNASIDYTHIPELMDTNWIGYWFNGILIQQKIIFISSFSALFLFIFNSGLPVNSKRLRTIFFILFLMAVGWFFSAPSPRFGYGTLLILAFFPFCLFFGKHLSQKTHTPILYIILFAVCLYLTKKTQPLINNPEHFVSTFSMQTPQSNKHTINGMEVNIPEITNSGWMRDCFDTELPCTCQGNKYLFPRGNSFKKGFRMYPVPDSTFVRQYVY